MKKHNWMQYGRQGEKIEIIIRDFNGLKLDFFTCNSNEDYRKILEIIKSKYGFNFKPKISPEDSINKFDSH